MRFPKTKKVNELMKLSGLIEAVNATDEEVMITDIG